MNSSSHPPQIGRYQILRLIGAGGMGDVYLARDPNIERQLAIKTVRLRGAPADVADHKLRLLREAKAAGRLVHANVVTLFDAGEADGLLYLAFEFVDGPDLGRRMKSPPALTLRHSLALVRQIAEGLGFAHHQGIIHRDIKPSNILIDPRGQAKIADFGLAKMNDESMELTRSGSVVGSPQYMSPEQVRGEALDGRTDIFSLGVLFYELMSSMRPFGGQTISTLVYEILSKDPPALAQVRPDLPPGIAGLVKDMLAKDLASRVGTADEVVARLDQVMGGMPAAMLDAPAVTPVDANAPTELMAATPTPGSPRAQPPSTPASIASVPGGSPSPPPGPPGAPPVPPPVATMPLPTAPQSSVAPQSSTPSSFPPPPTPPRNLPDAQPTAGHPTSAVGPPTSGGAASASSNRKIWMLAGVGVLFLLALAVGIWQLGKVLQGGLGSSEETTVAETTTDETEAREPGVRTPPSGASTPDETTTEQTSVDRTQPQVTPPGGSSEAGDSGGPEVSAVTTDPSRETGRSGNDTPPGRAGDADGTSDTSEGTPRGDSTPSLSPDRSTPPPQSAPRQTPSAPPPATSTTVPTTTSTSTQTPPRPADTTPEDSAVAEFDAAAKQAHREMTTGRYFKFMVEPDNAVVRLWHRGEERQVVLGQAKSYSAKDRDGRSVELPEDGDYLFTFIADGFPNFSVLVHATGGRGLGAQVIRASLANAVQGPKSLRVSRSLAFNGFPEDARVLIDGVEKGPASNWPGGLRAGGARNLQLAKGRYQLRLEAEGYAPYEILVEVTAGARRSATVRYDLRRAN